MLWLEQNPSCVTLLPAVTRSCQPPAGWVCGEVPRDPSSSQPRSCQMDAFNIRAQPRPSAPFPEAIPSLTLSCGAEHSPAPLCPPCAAGPHHLLLGGTQAPDKWPSPMGILLFLQALSWLFFFFFMSFFSQLEMERDKSVTFPESTAVQRLLLIYQQLLEHQIYDFWALESASRRSGSSGRKITLKGNIGAVGKTHSYWQQRK